MNIQNLKNAPILVLDEVTSNVNPVNEALIQEAICQKIRNTVADPAIIFQ